ncbi:TRAP transporter large permease subunit, partial [Pseudacidovorax intermedius]|uniref:TRAP transporter large permease subunit n=1 Tax=Pseudacidovorax intermedius TaxID=433924 RepID=UPI0026F01450
MQTSFMHPPFGFALFFLRSVAPDKPYVDRVTRTVMQPVTTMQIYKGAIPFVLIQLVMVGVMISFPNLVTGSLDKVQSYDLKSIGDQMRESLQPEGGGASPDAGYGSGEEPYGGTPAPGGDPAPAAPASPEAAPAAPDADAPASTPDDPVKAMEEALKRAQPSN